jgi:hypothetical protein
VISTRYAPAICVLLALCLVPTLIHSYSPHLDGDGRAAAAVGTSLAGYIGSPSDRNATWGERHFDSRDWVERTYRDGSDEARLTIVRSYDAKTLYHHPELAIAYGTDFVRENTRTLRLRPDMPVHVLQPGPGTRAIGLYVLHYDGRFIEDPIRFQIRSALEMLVSRRKPMTLFFVVDTNVPAGADVDTLGAARLLLAAVDSFTAQTGSR